MKKKVQIQNISKTKSVKTFEFLNIWFLLFPDVFPGLDKNDTFSENFLPDFFPENTLLGPKLEKQHKAACFSSRAC